MGCHPDSEGKTVTAWNADIEQSHESPCMGEEADLSVHCWAECDAVLASYPGSSLPCREEPGYEASAVSLQSSVLYLILETHALEESCSWSHGELLVQL